MVVHGALVRWGREGRGRCLSKRPCFSCKSKVCALLSTLTVPGCFSAPHSTCHEPCHIRCQAVRTRGGPRGAVSTVRACAIVHAVRLPARSADPRALKTETSERWS